MNKLFGTAKKKEEPKPNINAPTLSETSAKVYSDKILRICSNQIMLYRWTKEAKLSMERSRNATKSLQRSRKKWLQPKEQD